MNNTSGIINFYTHFNISKEEFNILTDNNLSSKKEWKDEKNQFYEYYSNIFNETRFACYNINKQFSLFNSNSLFLDNIEEHSYISLFAFSDIESLSVKDEIHCVLKIDFIYENIKEEELIKDIKHTRENLKEDLLNHAQENIKPILQKLKLGVREKDSKVQEAYNVLIQMNVISHENLNFEERKNLCIKLGTMGGNMSDNYKKSLDENLIDVYAKWTGLALMNQLVFVNSSENSDKNNICESIALRRKKNYYYSLTYIVQQYIKDHVTSINNTININDYKSDTSKYTDYIIFSKLYDHKSISNNFLINLIHQKIRKGLETNDQIDLISMQIEELENFQNQHKTDKTNLILLIIALLAVWSSFLNDFNDYFSESNIKVIALPIAIITSGFCLYYYFLKKKNI